MRHTYVLVLVAIAACNSNGGTSADGSVVDSGPPSGWTCPARDYADGVVCHCECGIPDPDCATAGALVSNCTNTEICGTDGHCTNCGNGDVDPGEQCDTARSETGDCGAQGYEPGPAPCKAGCTWAYDQCTPLQTCGNGQLDAAELCDGTMIQAGLDCTDYSRTSGTLACKTGCAIDSTGCYTCGDGRVEGPEACDDFDTSGGDGCSGTCTVESGWSCSGAPSACAPVCGDGIKVGSETCDDGNANPNDGCSSACKVEQDCTCTGTPSTCSCATVQTIATQTNYVYFDTASLVLDATNQPHVVYYYGLDYTDPNTNYLMEHGHLELAERPAATWQSSEITTWDATRSSLGPEELVMANDGGTIRVYFHRFYNAGGPFSVATRTGTSWSFAYDPTYYAYDVVRGNGAWQGLVAPQQFGSLHYYSGGPNAWTIDDTITAVNTGYELHVGTATNGDAYIAAFTPASGHTSYNMKLVKRVNATTWSTEYDVATTGACVYPVWHQPVALPGGGMIVFEDGFAVNGAAHTRWIRAHRFDGTAWVVEDVADLSFSSTTCSAGGSSYSLANKVTAVDALGQPHILFASGPDNNSMAFEDHYRDATGWHVRTTPITGGVPLDMKIDSTGATHILARAPGGASGASKLIYLRVSATAWH